jgi:glycosyltransferase involved in cell wall biosynthesis
MRSASIVIPTFNRAGLVSRAIDSALAQTYPCEVIVCDHGSTDATPDVAARYGDRIRYIRRSEDKGPIACWRDGLEQASGDVVQINYDDDWIEPEFMAKCIALLHDDVGFVYTQFTLHEMAAGSFAFSTRHPAGIRPMRDIVRYLLRFPLTISPGCALFRRKDALQNLLIEVPGASDIYGKNSGVGEDLLLFLLTSLNYPRYAYVAEPLANFMDHPQSITVNAIASKKYAQLAAAYANAKTHYYRQPRSERPRNLPLRIVDWIYWQVACGAVVKRGFRTFKKLLLRIFRYVLRSSVGYQKSSQK